MNKKVIDLWLSGDLPHCTLSQCLILYAGAFDASLYNRLTKAGKITERDINYFIQQGAVLRLHEGRPIIAPHIVKALRGTQATQVQDTKAPVVEQKVSTVNLKEIATWILSIYPSRVVTEDGDTYPLTATNHYLTSVISKLPGEYLDVLLKQTKAQVLAAVKDYTGVSKKVATVSSKLKKAANFVLDRDGESSLIATLEKLEGKDANKPRGGFNFA